MAEYTKSDPLNTPGFDALRKYLLQRESSPVGTPGDFEEHEKELRRLFAVAETEILAEDLARHDVMVKYITVEGERFRLALRASTTYVGQAGPMRVTRNLYQPVGGGRTICPLELRANARVGLFTPTLEGL